MSSAIAHFCDKNDNVRRGSFLAGSYLAMVRPKAQRSREGDGLDSLLKNPTRGHRIKNVWPKTALRAVRPFEALRSGGCSVCLRLASLKLGGMMFRVLAGRVLQAGRCCFNNIRDHPTVAFTGPKYAPRQIVCCIIVNTWPVILASYLGKFVLLYAYV